MEAYKGINGKWDFSLKEKRFIDYCVEHGYKIVECKQYVSKTKWKFMINNGITELWETLNDKTKFDKTCIDRHIGIRLELEALRNIK